MTELFLQMSANILFWGCFIFPNYHLIADWLSKLNGWVLNKSLERWSTWSLRSLKFFANFWFWERKDKLLKNEQSFEFRSRFWVFEYFCTILEQIPARKNKNHRRIFSFFTVSSNVEISTLQSFSFFFFFSTPNERIRPCLWF